MKVETIYFLERVNKGNYEHYEMSATAKVEENEDAITAMLALKTLVNAALNNKVSELKTETVEVKEAEVVKEEVVVKEEPKKVTKPKAKKEVVAAPKEEVVADVVQEEVVEVKKEEKVKPAKTTAYSAENKGVLQTYLTSKYAESWKTSRPRNEIIDFTSKLPGMAFLDDKGNILPEFLDHIHAFFG